VERSVRDIDNNKRRKFQYTILLDGSSGAVALAPQEISDRIKARVPSPSGDKVLVLCQQNSKDGDSPQEVWEIWKKGGTHLERRIDLSSQKLHGKVIVDDTTFGSLAWNDDETHVVYVAEQSKPVTKSFFEERKRSDSKSDQADSRPQSILSEPEPVYGGQYTMGFGKTETWGEKYSKQQALLQLFCLDVETGNIGRVENVPGQPKTENSMSNGKPFTTDGGFTLGQPVWSPDGKSVVYVGWDAGGGDGMPRRLGLIYCQQRPSKIYQSPVVKLLNKLAGNDTEKSTADDEAFVTVSPSEIRLARSPRFSPANPDKNNKHIRTMVYLAAKQPFDTHSGCVGLHAIDWDGEKFLADSSRIVVPQVEQPDAVEHDSPNSVAGMSFPGLFVGALPRKCFVSPSKVVTATQWGSFTKVVKVDLDSGTVDLVTGGRPFDSEDVLCTRSDGSLIIHASDPTRPSSVWEVAEDSRKMLLRLDPFAATRFSQVPDELPWQNVDVSVRTLSHVPSIQGVEQNLFVQSIVLLPDKSKYPKPPLIVVPHGGPHSGITTAFNPSYAYLCGQGYAVLMVNYRGSTGFGQKSITSLPTRIGEMDVQDVVAATNDLIGTGLVDPDRVGICGGSHGGFLTGHCTSQYPDLFKVAVMRNPVVNIASMVTATDIPDWCYVEATGSYKWNEFRPPTKGELDIMWEKSPVRHIDTVIAPTLVALGLADLRVPPSQGLEWYHSLRSRGVRVKLLTYPDDDHAIAGVCAEADHWVNIKRWFDDLL